MVAWLALPSAEASWGAAASPAAAEAAPPPAELATPASDTLDDLPPDRPVTRLGDDDEELGGGGLPLDVCDAEQATVAALSQQRRGNTIGRHMAPRPYRKKRRRTNIDYFVSCP